MASLQFPADWAEGVTERWLFLSQVTTSWGGAEQRSTLRIRPRVELEVELFAHGDDAIDLPGWLDAHQAEPVLIPWWPDGEGAAPSLTARLLEDVDLRWSTQNFARASVKATLIDDIDAPTAAVAQHLGLDYLPGPLPDFKEPQRDAWRRLQEVLDYKLGPFSVTDRSGFARRRWGLKYLLSGDEIAVARAFLWRRYGRARPGLFPAPNGGWARARLDADVIQFDWITPRTCRVEIGVITLLGES